MASPSPRSPCSTQTRIRQVQFRGVDASIEEWLGQLGLQQYHDAFLQAGIVQYSELWKVDRDAITAIVPSEEHARAVLASLDTLRSEATRLR